MKNLISRFYTLYWIIYFPTCIAFNELPGFSSIDEMMTGLIIFVTFGLYLSGNVKRNKDNRKVWSEYMVFWGIMAFYTLYSLLFGANVPGSVWLDFIQEIRPFSIIYCTWLLNPQFSRRQKQSMLASMIITLFLWIGMHPTGHSYDFEGNLVADEFPILGQMAICCGMAWYLFTKPTNRNKWIALGLVLTGMIAPKFKFLGEVVCFVAMLFFIKKRFNFKSSRTIITLCVVVTVVLMVTWTRFDLYYVSGMVDAVRARPLSYQTAFGKIIWDYFPFGSGMGSFACNGAWRYYSPLYYKYNLNEVWGLTEVGGFICDAYYPTLAQFGVVGIIFFIIYWKRRLISLNQIVDIRYYRIAWMAFFCLAIEQTSDSSWLSGKGMGYCMLLGLCLNANRNLADQKRKIEQLKKLQQQEKDKQSEQS